MGKDIELRKKTDRVQLPSANQLFHWDGSVVAMRLALISLNSTVDMIQFGTYRYQHQHIYISGCFFYDFAQM